MAETAGLVQRLTIAGKTSSCVWIGPTQDNVEALVISNDGTTPSVAFADSLVQALAAAATNYRQVVAVHGDSDTIITSLRIEPV